jgi:multidrug efflux pump subunit AcrB
VAHRSDDELIKTTRNTARLFVEERHIAWLALIAVIAWGVYGWTHMPKRKDPNLPVRIATASVAWPGVSAEQVEQLVTRPIEEAVGQNSYLHLAAPGSDFAILSQTMPGMAIVQVQLADTIEDTEQEFSDIYTKVAQIQLPPGAGPLQWNSGFGDTSALMLTVASPKERPVDVAIRAIEVSDAIRAVRGSSPGPRASIVIAFPRSVDGRVVDRLRDVLGRALVARGDATDWRPMDGSGFVGVDVATTLDDAALLDAIRVVAGKDLGVTLLHPDAWDPAIIRDPADTEARLQAVVGDRYTYREIDDFTDLISRALNGVPETSKTARSGVLQEQVTLLYSQDQLAAYGLDPYKLGDVLGARNIITAAGTVQTPTSAVLVDPSGQFKSAGEIANVAIAQTNGAPVYLRDLVDVTRAYQDPPAFLNWFGRVDPDGKWIRTKAVSISVYMRDGDQIAQFGSDVNVVLKELVPALPEDLVLARTSDQPAQVEEKLDLFGEALWEAVALVVVIAWIGFGEWRAAMLMALSIPITLAMTFGFMFTLGLDLQQVSIATLIIALGLLVDDPVVAGDAITNSLAAGHPSRVAAWLGPTKLARAIMFATITNIVAYMPFLMLTGNTGEFIWSLPVVMTCALVASRLTSMTFIPFLGYYLLRAPTGPEESMEDKRKKGFTGLYFRTGYWLIERRRGVLLCSFLFLGLGVLIGRQLPTAFFPQDVQYLSSIDVWLPNDAPLALTERTARRVEEIVTEVTAEYGRQHPGKDGTPRQILRSVTSFVGGGGPRFWSSISPQLQQLNYAQLIIEVTDKNDTPLLAGPLQTAMTNGVPGAVVQFQQLQTNPVANPIEVELTGLDDVTASDEAADIRTLRELAAQVTAILTSVPTSGNVWADWFEDTFRVRLAVDPDRANMAGITNKDVAASTAAGINGAQVATMRDGNKTIPVLARLRPEDRADLSDVEGLYVYSSANSTKIPLAAVSEVKYALETERIIRREKFRAITVIAYPVAGVLSSQVLAVAMERLDAFQAALPPGYQLRYGGELEKQRQSFGELVTIIGISSALIFSALVVQFSSFIKPLLVFAAVPYGVVGALFGLWVTGQPFGFMGFLGIASLVGVIVSHVIVLFDFIEQMRERGEPLVEALLDAGIQRLRPVMITVGATVLALFPLAMHGGPLWEPLCYAQIGGLSLATFIELLLVKVFYATTVQDLKLIDWAEKPAEDDSVAGAPEVPAGH